MKNNNKFTKMVDASDDYRRFSKQVSDKNVIFDRIINWLKRFGDNIGQHIKPEEFGHVIILIGQRKTGKSETIKTLCKQISGDKYIIKFDENLLPTKVPSDDKKDYEKISGCKIIEDVKQLSDASGLLILEDFPELTKDGSRAIYNMIKDSRHKGYQANYLIVAHDYKVLKNTVFNHANAILIYRDAPITPTQLGPRVNSLGNGHAIDRARRDLKPFHYIFVSFDNKRWHNPFLDSRNVDILIKAVRGQLKDSELSEISYSKKLNKSVKISEGSKKEVIRMLLELGLNPEEIATGLATSPDYIWKVKHYLKKEYIITHGEQNIPEYLKDSRKKPKPRNKGLSNMIKY